MNKYPFYILSAFVLGITSSVFFAHISSTLGKVSRNGNSSLLLASVIDSTVPPNVVLSLATSTPAATLFVATTSAAVVGPRKNEYKFLRNVDSCTLNKLGSQGWQAFQFGGTLDMAYGYDENCKNGKTYDVFDWILFSRDNSQ